MTGREGEKLLGGGLCCYAVESESVKGKIAG